MPDLSHTCKDCHHRAFTVVELAPPGALEQIRAVIEAAIFGQSSFRDLEDIATELRGPWIAHPVRTGGVS